MKKTIMVSAGFYVTDFLSWTFLIGGTDKITEHILQIGAFYGAVYTKDIFTGYLVMVMISEFSNFFVNM